VHSASPTSAIPDAGTASATAGKAMIASKATMAALLMGLIFVLVKIA
jgi:hypothetical protein